MYSAQAFIYQLHSIATIENAFPSEDKRPKAPSPQTNSQSVNILILGTGIYSKDSTDPQYAQHITLLNIPAGKTTANFISIPANFNLNIPGYGTGNLQLASRLGGSALVVETLESALQSRIEHVLLINFRGFANFLDKIGEIQVRNTQPFRHYSVLDGPVFFPKGYVSLNAQNVLKFAAGSTDSANPLHAAQSQAQVLVESIKKIVRSHILNEPNKLKELFNSSLPYIAVDKTVANAISKNNDELKNLKNTIFEKDSLYWTALIPGTEDEISRLQLALRSDSVQQFIESTNRSACLLAHTDPARVLCRE